MLNRKRFEPAAVEVAIADGPMGDAPANRVVCQSAEVAVHLPFTHRPDDEVPVVAHTAVGEDLQRLALMGGDEHASDPSSRCSLRAALYNYT